jgi:uncharacterized membrane protein
MQPGEDVRTAERARGAGIVLGVGLGGFIDGILLHMLLQWHHLICFTCHPGATLADLRRNIFFDGVFHAFTLALTALGVGLLWRALRGSHAPVPGRILGGALIFGWGLFNVVEGLVDHQILAIHHVRPGPTELGWDLGFLLVSAGLMLAGAMMMRLGTRARPAPPLAGDRIGWRAGV